MPLLALLALFILVPLAELYVILKVGEAIGAVWTILLLAADSVLGSLLLRAQGRSVWGRFNTALAEGKMPHREVIDGVLVIFGGAFLITPGFITDVVGLLLLIPPTRARDPAPARAPSGAAGRGRRRPRAAAGATTSRAPRARTPPHRSGSSGERPGARALVLRPGAGDLRDRPLGGDHPLRGPPPGAHPKGPASSRPGNGWRAELAGVLELDLEPVAEADRARRADCAGLPRDRPGRRPGAWKALGTVVGDALAPELGRARRAAHHLRARGREPRLSGCGPPPAGRAGPRRGVGDGALLTTMAADDRGGRAHLDRLRRRAADSAAPGSSCGCPARSCRTAGRDT